MLYIEQEGMTLSKHYCPNCGRELHLDYAYSFALNDEYGYYFCDNNDFTDDLGYGGGDISIFRSFMRDKDWRILEGPTQDEFYHTAAV